MAVAIKHGVPAILSDLTNSIRYGDICLLGESIPKIIEIKSSRNTSSRIFRQVDSIKLVQSYLDKDEASNIRGFPRMKRVDLHSKKVTYTRLLNKLISSAIKRGSAFKEVEKGVIYYVQIADNNMANFPDELLKQQGDDENIFYYLNTLKNERGWINYFPYTLSIHEPANVFRFLYGDIQIMVFINFRVFREYASDNRFELKEINNKFGVKYSKIGSNDPKDVFFISSHFLGRVAYEFTSLSWIVNESFLQYYDAISFNQNQLGIL